MSRRGSRRTAEGDKILPFTRSTSSRADARLAEFLETARRLKDERTKMPSVAEILDATPTEQWMSLASDERFQTSAALEKLGEEVRRRLARDPREAVALAELATTIADALPDDAYPEVTRAQIRAMAWKDRANTLRFLTRYEEAFDAISRAEAVLEPHIALALDRAIVGIVKALLLVDTGKSDAGRELAIKCGAVFLSHGDVNRAMYATEVEGHALFERKQYDDASSLFGSLLDIARAVDEEEVVARCHHNIGWCSVFRDDFKAANIHFSEAIAKLTDLGEPVSGIRAQWGAGRVFIGKGQFELGFQYLESARESFKRFEMTEEAGLCGLEMAEALLDRGDEAKARALVEEVATEFQRSPFDRHIVDALSSLQQQIADTETAVKAVRSVYAMIEAARSEQSHM